MEETCLKSALCFLWKTESQRRTNQGIRKHFFSGFAVEDLATSLQGKQEEEAFKGEERTSIVTLFINFLLSPAGEFEFLSQFLFDSLCLSKFGNWIQNYIGIRRSFTYCQTFEIRKSTFCLLSLFFFFFYYENFEKRNNTIPCQAVNISDWDSSSLNYRESMNYVLSSVSFFILKNKNRLVDRETI